MTYPSGHCSELDIILAPVYGQPEETPVLQSPLDLPVLTSMTVAFPDPVTFQ